MHDIKDSMFGEPQVASYFATDAANGASDDSISDRLKKMQSMSVDEMKQKIEGTKEQERLAAEQQAANEAKRRAAIAEGTAKAKAAFAAGDYAAAEAEFTRVLDENPDNRVEIVCNRAACSLKLGAYSDAVSDAAEAACGTSGCDLVLAADVLYSGEASVHRALRATLRDLALPRDARILHCYECRWPEIIKLWRSNLGKELVLVSRTELQAPCSIGGRSLVLEELRVNDEWIVDDGEDSDTGTAVLTESRAARSRRGF